MSIFPKRTLQGGTVTVHWNFNIAHLTVGHVMPFVRIGVKAPDGKITMLFERHVIGLPAVPQEADKTSKEPRLSYLNKNTPLLVLADYLSTHHKRELLVDILENIQSGRHYYFTFRVENEAPLGKYELISEIHNNGKIKYSNTAGDDFFLVEKVLVTENSIVNLSPEKTPVKIVAYQSGGAIASQDISVFELAPGEERLINGFSKYAFLVYNEEREVIPLQREFPLCLRSQQALTIEGPEGVHVMLADHIAYTLAGQTLEIWKKADGTVSRNELCAAYTSAAYQEMIDNQLITEIFDVYEKN